MVMLKACSSFVTQPNSFKKCWERQTHVSWWLTDYIHTHTHTHIFTYLQLLPNVSICFLVKDKEISLKWEYSSCTRHYCPVVLLLCVLEVVSAISISPSTSNLAMISSSDILSNLLFIMYPTIWVIGYIINSVIYRSHAVISGCTV